MSYSATCHCGQVELTLRLPKALSQYTPRACDCDFCANNDVSYLSDPDGELDIVSSISLFHTRQGSMQADFLRCVNCEQVVAVVASLNGRQKGAINAECLLESKELNTPESVSPHTLTPEEKRVRWEKLWFDVTLSEPD